MFWKKKPREEEGYYVVALDVDVFSVVRVGRVGRKVYRYIPVYNWDVFSRSYSNIPRWAYEDPEDVISPAKRATFKSKELAKAFIDNEIKTKKRERKLTIELLRNLELKDRRREEFIKNNPPERYP